MKLRSHKFKEKVWKNIPNIIVTGEISQIQDFEKICFKLLNNNVHIYTSKLMKRYRLVILKNLCNYNIPSIFLPFKLFEKLLLISFLYTLRDILYLPCMFRMFYCYKTPTFRKVNLSLTEIQKRTYLCNQRYKLKIARNPETS